jgi:hypothetical protein
MSFLRKRESIYAAALPDPRLRGGDKGVFIRIMIDTDQDYFRRSHCHFDRKPPSPSCHLDRRSAQRAGVERSGRERAVSGARAKVRRTENRSGRESASQIKLRNIRGQMSRLRCASLDMTRGGAAPFDMTKHTRHFSGLVQYRLSSGNIPGVPCGRG